MQAESPNPSGISKGNVVDELLEADTSSLPLGLQKIYVAPLLAKEDLAGLIVENRKFRFRENARGATKPLSKIVP